MEVGGRSHGEDREINCSSENLVRVVILDISGVYAQIHNQGYFDKSSIDDIRQQYSNTERWRVVVLDE